VSADYVNVRDVALLGSVIGTTVVDVTQQDRDEFVERGSFVAFHFSNGVTAYFPVSEAGFVINGVESGTEEDGGDTRGSVQD
jgi:hypothetical protein